MEGEEETRLNETLSTVIDEDGSFYCDFGSDSDSDSESDSNPSYVGLGLGLGLTIVGYGHRSPLPLAPAVGPAASTRPQLDLKSTPVKVPCESLPSFDQFGYSAKAGNDNDPDLQLYLSFSSESELSGSESHSESNSNIAGLRTAPPPVPESSSDSESDSEADLLGILRKACCKQNCLQSFSIRDLQHCRASLINKRGAEIRQFVMDSLRNHCQFTGTKLTTGFSVLGKPICQAGWRLAYNISGWRYRDCVKRVRAGKTSGRRLPGPSGNIREKTRSALAWMSLIFTRMGDFMPHKDAIHLPHSWTKRYVYDRMVREESAAYGGVQRELISYEHFTRIWRKNFPKYIISQSSDFTKCSTCTQLKDQYERAVTDAARDQIIDLRIRHDNLVIAERIAYQRARLKARREPSELTCLIIDGMDQSKTNVPHFVVQDKDNEHLAQLPVHFTGVLVHSPTAEGKIPIIYYDVKHLPHDSNLTIHCLTEALNEVKDNLGEKLFLQLDNCARENKNRFVLSYISLLVQLELFKEATIHFLPVGHTHEDVDQMFSCISSALRHTDAFTLKDLEEVASKSYTPPVKMVAVKMIQNVKDELAKHMSGPFRNHSRPLWFRFRKADGQTHMHYKLWEGDPWEPAADSDWPMGLVCLENIPDHHQQLPWVETSLEKANPQRLRQEVPHGYNLRLPQASREWWIDFLAAEIESYEQAPPEMQWRLGDVLPQNIAADPEEDTDNTPLALLRTRIDQTCPPITIGHQGQGPKGICRMSDYSSLKPGMLAAVHCEETVGRPFIGRLTEVLGDDVAIDWFKGTWTGIWRPWMTKTRNQSIPYSSTIPKNSVILWDFSLTTGLKLKQTTVRELRSKYDELDG